MASTLDRLVYEVGRLLKVVSAVISADGGPGAMLRSLGWDLPPGVNDIGLAAVDLSTLVQKVDDVEDALNSGASDAVVAEKFAELLLELQRGIAHFNAAIAGLSAAGDYMDKTQIKTELSPRMNGVMVATRIGAVSPFALLVLQFFGVVTLRHFDADPGIYQVEHVRTTFDWDALGRMFTDPVGLLETRYGWGTANFDGRSFLTNLCALVEALGEPVRLRQLPRRVEEQLAGKSVPEADANPATQLIASFVRGDEASGLDVGVALFPLRATTSGAADAGVAVCPFVFGSADVSFTLSDQLTLDFDSTVALDSGIALQFRPGYPMSLKAGLLGSGGVVDGVTGKAVVRLTYAAPTGGRLTLIEIPGGGVIDVDSIAFGGGVDASRGELAPSFLAKLTGGRARLNWDGSDGFLGSLMPSSGADMTFDLGLRWSGAQGLSFEGSVSADIDVPVYRSIAGLRIDMLHLGIRPSGSGLALEASLTCGADIGPLAISLDRVGTLATFAFHDGNLGPVDLSLAFLPPDGAGLVIDAAGVTGGGFLGHDEAKHEYSGVLQLQFIDLALQAFGLITTQVAGRSGYSLLVLVDAEFPPVQLGWGFTLNGVGGLLAINRTASTDALHAALKAGQLSSILFPKNAITNAPAILGQLDTLFPTASGRFLFGPMALIGWGTPTVLTAAIAVVVELPEPIRIILLARIEARLPDASAPLVSINMDALGVLDLGQDELSFDAVLFDSKLVGFTLSGAMALRATWGQQRGFVLAIGGFHPRFTPPPGFPALQRITIDMPSGIVSKLRLAAYLALTSNTIQIGANLDVFIGVSGFGLSGHLGFDALLQRHPFQFAADISGSVALTAGGDDLASVSLDATLTGPAPYNIAGKFKVHIVFFDVHVSFNHSWGDDAPSQAVASVDVGALLAAALAERDSWDALLPDGVRPLVSVRQIADGGRLLAHPLARPQVHERLVPLGLAITRFGEAVPSTGTQFTITNLNIGSGPTIAHEAIEDDFAPAQFFDLSDEEKLERPSFERHAAGVRVTASPDLVTVGTPVAVKTTEYETFYIDTPGALPRPDPVRVKPPLGDLGVVLAFGAARQATTTTARGRYQAAGHPIRVAEPAFVAVDRTTLAASGVGPAAGATFIDLHALVAANRNLQIIAKHEIAA
jgi:hypothetical protein